VNVIYLKRIFVCHEEVKILFFLDQKEFANKAETMIISTRNLANCLNKIENFEESVGLVVTKVKLNAGVPENENQIKNCFK
jgi:hypothetical protein